MTRNANRTGLPKEEEQSQPQARRHVDNPFGISFVVPKDIVPLPSKGKLYDQGHPLSGVESIEIKGMTSKEEDILINSDFIREGVVFDKLIDSLIVDKRVRSTDMLDCDKLAILVTARKTGYGDQVDLDYECDHCGTKSVVTCSLQKAMENSKNNNFEFGTQEGVEFDENSKTLSFELPKSKIFVKIKMMSPSDHKYLEDLEKQKMKHSLEHSKTVEFLRRVVVEANGVADQTQLSKLAEALPTIDARKIRNIHNSNIPNMSLVQEIECPSCGHKTEEEVPFSLGMFWDNA